MRVIIFVVGMALFMFVAAYALEGWMLFDETLGQSVRSGWVNFVREVRGNGA